MGVSRRTKMEREKRKERLTENTATPTATRARKLRMSAYNIGMPPCPTLPASLEATTQGLCPFMYRIVLHQSYLLTMMSSM